jgi:Helix-hairpin-helix domain
LYPAGSYSQAQSWKQVGLRLREFCQEEGISDRIPRPIIVGEKRSLNKRIVEVLADQCYWMDLENASSQRVWAYRKAAWAIEDLEQDIGLVYRQMGRKGLEAIENVGPKMVTVVETLLNGFLDNL